MKKWASLTAEEREKRREWGRNNYLKNKKYILARNKKWRDENRTKCNAQKLNWLRNSPCAREKRRAYIEEYRKRPYVVKRLQAYRDANKDRARIVRKQWYEQKKKDSAWMAARLKEKHKSLSAESPKKKKLRLAKIRQWGVDKKLQDPDYFVRARYKSRYGDLGEARRILNKLTKELADEKGKNWAINAKKHATNGAKPKGRAVGYSTKSKK